MSIDISSDKWVTHVAEILQARRSASGADTVEQFFAAPVPETLWHYTSLAGLNGILTTNRIWATEARSTTDAKEFIHAREIATQYLERQNPTSEAGRFAREIGLKLVSEEFETGTLSERQTEVFVASFCSEGNLKSQWMEYADSGRGVGIALDLRDRRPPIEYRVAVTLAPCVYSRSEAERLIDAALRHFLDTAAQLYADTNDLGWVAGKRADWRLVDKIFDLPFERSAFDRHMDQEFDKQLRVALTLTKYDLLRLASHCKNPYFIEEREWRLSLAHTKGTPLTQVTVEKRGPNKNIPYVAHNLFSVDKLPITEIMVGPFCDGIAQVEGMLEATGYKVKITKSETPTRRPEEIR